ncbi:hypothetical protein GCK72_007736 [Caenorhabditis remanei]|uniref:Uncharacterized protein n=1 Tax=Caenorhabditis remanei TaxID=31234 RepID=A0A6A5HN71_CAERE|nr:hypothetical protein GCK72_007736 [Caenorhabditis remanei]KAF1767777.1 hypothetical protein GCK72_007736 [Caenorhabditis remanei]
MLRVILSQFVHLKSAEISLEDPMNLSEIGSALGIDWDNSALITYRYSFSISDHRNLQYFSACQVICRNWTASWCWKRLKTNVTTTTRRDAAAKTTTRATKRKQNKVSEVRKVSDTRDDEGGRFRDEDEERRQEKEGRGSTMRKSN